MKEFIIAVAVGITFALLIGFVLLLEQGKAVAADQSLAVSEQSEPDRGAVPEVETEHGRISLSAGSTPGIWVSSKKSNAVVCLYIEPSRGQPVIGMYSDKYKSKFCNFSVTCDKDGEAEMQLVNKDGKVRILQLSQLFDAIQSLDQSVSVGDSNK